MICTHIVPVFWKNRTEEKEIVPKFQFAYRKYVKEANGSVFRHSLPINIERISVVDDTIPKDFIVPHGILLLAAAVAGIALNGIDDAVLAFLHDAHMIRAAVL